MPFFFEPIFTGLMKRDFSSNDLYDYPSFYAWQSHFRA